MTTDNVKRSELLHFSRVKNREEVLVLDAAKRAELIESAMAYLYRMPDKASREELLGLVQTIVKSDMEVTNLCTATAYTVCNRHLVITYVNDFFLKRSAVEREEILGKSLYYEREYEGSEIEQLYSMVMETRMLGDTLVRYVGLGHDGWFSIVVIPLDEGGIGVLSRFAKEKEQLAGELDSNSPDAPRFITLSQAPAPTTDEDGDEEEDGDGDHDDPVA